MISANGEVSIARLRRASLRVVSFWRKQTHPEASWCNVCGFCGKFRDPTNGANLRESLICAFCGSRSRDRMLIYALGNALGVMPPLRSWPEDRSRRILETTGHGAHPYFIGRKFDYYNAQYDAERIAAGADPHLFADVQALPYANEWFDCVLSSDVFEHVRLDQKGFAEIHRVLKPGGIFVLQVPYDDSISKTRILVEPRDNQDAYLEPPQYHAKRTLVYRIYGRDLVWQLEQRGFCAKHISMDIPKHAISFQDFFVAQKG